MSFAFEGSINYLDHVDCRRIIFNFFIIKKKKRYFSESRARWGDRGVGVGHLWEPAWEEPAARLPPHTERLDRSVLDIL